MNNNLTTLLNDAHAAGLEIHYCDRFIEVRNGAIGIIFWKNGSIAPSNRRFSKRSMTIAQARNLLSIN